MPEFIIEDIADYFIINLKDYLTSVTWFPFDDLMTLLVLLIGSPSYVKNPYLRGKLIDVFAQLVYNSREKYYNEIATLFSSNKVVCSYLAQVLMKFYVDIENTGSHIQFVSKFSIRQNIHLVLDFAWKIPTLQHSMIEASKNEQFIHFISKVLNDATFLLEEGLLALHEIKQMQLEMKSDSWNELTQVSLFFFL